MNNFGTNLKNIRKSQGISQQALAKMIGTTAQRVSEWECGKVEPGLSSIKKLIKALDTSFEELTE